MNEREPFSPGWRQRCSTAHWSRSQRDYARVIAAVALALRSEEPVLSQIKKLIPDSQVICQSSKTHAFIRVPHAFVAGGHGGLLPMRVLGGSDGRLRRSRELSSRQATSSAGGGSSSTNRRSCGQSATLKLGREH